MGDGGLQAGEYTVTAAYRHWCVLDYVGANGLLRDSGALQPTAHLGWTASSQAGWARRVMVLRLGEAGKHETSAVNCRRWMKGML